MTSSPTIIAAANNPRLIRALTKTGRLRVTPKIPASPIVHIQMAILPVPGNEPLNGISFPLALPASTVKVVETAPATGFTLGGLKLQFAPAGNPEHANPTTCLNPFFGVSVIVKVPEAPFVTLRDELLIASE